MKQYGKIINDKLSTPTAILIGSDWTTNPSPVQYRSQGYKLIIDNGTTFSNYERTYEETETEITVIYTEVITPEIWDYDTAIKVKMNSDRFIAMVSEVNSILPDTSRNISMFGVTEFYIDEIKEEFRTLIMYFDCNAKIIEMI